jgi:hypothetical protein
MDMMEMACAKHAISVCPNTAPTWSDKDVQAREPVHIKSVRELLLSYSFSSKHSVLRDGGKEGVS